MPHFYAFQDIVPVVDPSAFVHETAVVIGDVIIGPGCYIGPGASLRGDMGRISVGRGSNIQDNCVVHCFPGADTILGEECHVGHGAVLHGCTLGRNVLIGMNAVVMDGATVGDSSIVGAMAFVRAGDTIPPRTVVTGIPAKPRRQLNDEEVAWKTSATGAYQELARQSLRTLRPVAPRAAPEPDRRRLAASGLKPLHETRGE